SALHRARFEVVRRDRHGVVEQTKFAASFVSPEPMYFAIAGYGQSGRLWVTPPGSDFVARSVSGATPFSTQLTTVGNRFCGCGPTPPPQCATPGATEWRYDCRRWPETPRAE